MCVLRHFEEESSWGGAFSGPGITRYATEAIYSSLGRELGQGGFLKESLLVIISPFILSRPSLNWPRQIQAENAIQISLAF